jgi:hypothetical protein
LKEEHDGLPDDPQKEGSGNHSKNGAVRFPDSHPGLFLVTKLTNYMLNRRQLASQ